MLKLIWDFFQNQMLAMKGLNIWIGNMLSGLGLDIDGRLGGSIQFFIYDTIKIFILLSVLIFLISTFKAIFHQNVLKKYWDGFMVSKQMPLRHYSEQLPPFALVLPFHCSSASPVRDCLLE